MVLFMAGEPIGWDWIEVVEVAAAREPFVLGVFSTVEETMSSRRLVAASSLNNVH